MRLSAVRLLIPEAASAADIHPAEFVISDFPAVHGKAAFGSNRHTAAIIYLPNPIILTVMTLDNPVAESTIADLGKLFADYSLTVDARLEQYRAEQEAARLAEEEARRQAEEEAQRLAAEAAGEPDAAAPDAAEVLNPAEETPAEAASPASVPGRENTSLRLYVLIGMGGIGLVCLLIYLLSRKRR